MTIYQVPTLTVAPTATPIGTTEAKAHLRVDHSDEDDLITALVQAATAHLDGYTGILGRALVTQTWAQKIDDFPTVIRLPLAPVQSVTSITYYDGANASQTLDSASYHLASDAAGAYIALNEGYGWPGVYNRPDAVTVTFVAGYGAAADVPSAIKAVIKLLVGHWYEHREAAGEPMTELPLAAASLLAPYRRISL